MAFDVFISYATEDKLVANAVCARLESAGIRCWIAPRDIVAGRSYGEAIIEAIHTVKVMVLVFSSSANASGHIPKEVERAVSHGLAILPLRIEDVTPAKSLDYFIGSVHWLDAMTPPLERHLDELVETVQKLLPAGTHAAAAAPAPAGTAPAAGTASRKSPKTLAIGAVAALLVAAAVWGATHFGTRAPANAASASASANPAAVRSAAPPASATAADPIVGCYHWFNNITVSIYPNGTMIGGPMTAHWRVVNATERSYALAWPEESKPVFTVTVSADQHSLSGLNQYQFPMSATRAGDGTGLVGSWSLSNSILMVVAPNGTFTAATFSGTWRTVDAGQGVYSLTWPPLIDTVTLSANAQQLAGANQYGVAVSGTRTQPCSLNY